MRPVGPVIAAVNFMPRIPSYMSKLICCVQNFERSRKKIGHIEDEHLVGGQYTTILACKGMNDDKKSEEKVDVCRRKSS